MISFRCSKMWKKRIYRIEGATLNRIELSKRKRRCWSRRWFHCEEYFTFSCVLWIIDMNRLSCVTPTGPSTVNSFTNSIVVEDAMAYRLRTLDCPWKMDRKHQKFKYYPGTNRFRRRRSARKWSRFFTQWMKTNKSLFLFLPLYPMSFHFSSISLASIDTCEGGEMREKKSWKK